jgi:hypothetical protein
MSEESTRGSGGGAIREKGVSTRRLPPAMAARVWKPGQSANPNGRPVASRQKLTDKFIKDLAEHYDKEGMRAIERVAEDNPLGYLQIVCRLLPKDVTLTVSTDLSSALPQDQLKRIAEAWMLSQHDDSVLEGESVVTSDPELAALPAPTEEPDPVPVRCVESVPPRKGLTASKRPRIDLETVVDEDD